MQKKIIHIIWGSGTIVDIEGKYLRAIFDNSEVGFKTFIYPDAFDHHIKYVDPALQAQIEQLLEQRRKTDMELQRIARQKQQQAALAARVKLLETKAKGRKLDAARRSQKAEQKKQKNKK